MNSRAQIEGRYTVRSALRQAIAQLAQAKTPSHTLAAELLLMHAIGRDRAWIYAHPEEALSEQAARTFSELIARRATGVPAQYLTGKQEFWGLEFKVTPAVLIPRPETEHVVEVALERLAPRRGTQTALSIADVGTGSGCIAIAFAREFPGAEILATDISAAALGIARRNAERHGVSRRVHFLQCDLLDAARLAGSFDLVASNPPYVARAEEKELPLEVGEHEPHRALFGGEAGTEIYARLIEQAGERLRSGGLIVVEIGYGAVEHVHSLFDGVNWRDVRVQNDLAGIPRVISAERIQQHQ